MLCKKEYLSAMVGILSCHFLCYMFCPAMVRAIGTHDGNSPNFLRDVASVSYSEVNDDDLTYPTANLSRDYVREGSATSNTREKQRNMRTAAKRTSGIKALLPAPKHAKKTSIHHVWFVRFVEIVKKIDQDGSDEEAWDKMADVLDEGGKNGFLATSITFFNDSNPKTEYEYTSLHYVAARGILSLVQELVNHEKVSVDVLTQERKNTPLHLAASRGHLDVVQFLIERGAQIGLVDHEGSNALYYAAASRSGEISRDVVEYLVHNGADYKQTIEPNTSMLDMAVIAGNLPVIEYWEDSHTNSNDPNIDVLTEAALLLAKHRQRYYPKEKRIQMSIIKSLENILGARNSRVTRNLSSK